MNRPRPSVYLPPPDARCVYSAEYVANIVNAKQVEAYAEGRADERNELAALLDAERERCARLCDILTMGGSDGPQARGAERCARAIRAIKGEP